MRFRAFFSVLLISVLLSAFLSSCSRQERTIITNVDVIPMTSENLLEKRDVIIAGEKIVSIVESGMSEPESGDKVIDGTGKYLIPGLADLVLLEANPLKDISNTRKISGVMAKGRWYPREEIDAMLEFDPEIHRAQLDLFEACLALKEGDPLPLDEYVESSDYTEAKDCFYGYPQAMAAFIGALHEQGMDEKAASHFDAAVGANWDDVNFLNGICWTVGVELKIESIYPAAIAAARRALEINRHPAILDTIAWLYAFSGDYDKALEAIGEAKSLDPDNEVYEETRTRIIEMQRA